ncbi:MAG: hypothetical protein CBB97_00215 [Candidatus Endolissoclinum sp. TMED37]|nr:MAG: hypothetical protein CBB97_00215 [Candidatus Endolissoclinum sp. TMED37]
MRPLKLTIEALGPFAGKEVIDFTQIGDQQLFGIYGETGSGKSSIFEAIAFALFGKGLKRSSDNNRKNVKNFRSHHSDINVLCQVEFIFEASNNKYLIRRIPAQSTEKRKDVPAESYLFDVTGIHIDDISETNRGRILSEKKKKDSEEQIENILGYGIETFEQIVLLPQGKFEKFLQSSTKDKKEILRSLFDVSLYEKLATKFSEDSKEVQTEIDRLTERKKGQLSIGEFLSAEELVKSIEEEISKTEELQQKATADQKYFEEIKTTKEKYSALTEAKEKLSKLLNKKTEYDQLEIIIKKISNTEKLLASHKAVEEKKLKLDSDKKKIDQSEKEYKETKEAIEKNKAERHLIESHKDEFVKKREKLHKFQDYEKRLQSAKGEQAEASNKKNELEQINSSIERKELEKLHKEALTYENAKNDFYKLKNEVKNLETSTSTLKNSLNTANAVFDKAEQQLSEMQAIHLSRKLIEGEACPVCGSHDHPSPAKGHPESKGLNEAFEKAKADKESIKDIYDKEISLLLSKKGQITGSEKTFSDKNTSNLSSSEIKLKLSKLNFGYKEDEKNLGINELKTKGEEVAKTYNKLIGSLETLLQDIPKELQNINMLNGKIETLENEIAAYDTKEKNLEKNERIFNEKLAGLQSAQKILMDSFNSSQEQLEKTEEDFVKFLDQYKFQGKEEFEKYLPRISELQIEEEKLADYKKSITEANGAVKNLEATIKNIDQIRPERLQAQFVEALSMQEVSQNYLTSNKNKIKNLENLKKNVEQIDTEIQELRDGHLSLINLSTLFNGKEKGQRIGLETFALKKMFELILKAGNKRLSMMTKRYQLEIETETKGNAEHGLEISVNDIFTGSNRPIERLSGGETFMASLSLALGLSDIVQSSSKKNIRLDTIFIDEGFGSLDSETLEEVLNTLQENIASSRAVGLVSHVDTVKSTVPAGFYIEKTASGSHVKLSLE